MYRWTFVCVILTLLSQSVWCQITINGQIFTNGLSIIDSPALDTPFSAGSTLPVAIDVSGDGKLASTAAVPGSGLSTRFDLLEIYLVSSETEQNITVSSGPGLLSGETGTVRHLNWPILTCTPAGNYNLTFYETSHINGEGYFSITPIPVKISNSGDTDSCSASETNKLQSQPQASSAVSQSPFLPASAIITLEYTSTVTLVTETLGRPTTTT
ncbi:hypothetical protein H0H92_001516 [Tricholoma furcatifolium]|nr:hypothetical protein H0H92_001516 [Tricholoma furcatifolium]